MAFSFTLSNPALGTQEQIEAKLRFYIISGSKRKRQKIRREKKKNVLSTSWIWSEILFSYFPISYYMVAHTQKEKL